jgi:hypothetical protein
MSEKRINVELLGRVRDHILEDTRRFNMDRYVNVAYGTDAPHCGTIGCIAGWAVMLVEGIPEEISDSYYAGVAEDARRLLGLTYWEAENLFHVSMWPKEYKDRFLAADSIDEEAKVAADFINAIIAAGEVLISED